MELARPLRLSNSIYGPVLIPTGDESPKRTTMAVPCIIVATSILSRVTYEHNDIKCMSVIRSRIVIARSMT